MEMGADGFELDVHMSADGELVVMHDETVDRTTNGTGRIRELTLAQLKELDACNGMAHYRGVRIPTLGEVFALIRNTRHLINVEVKTDECFYPRIEEKCLALAKEMGVEERIVYSSFNHHTLLRLRELKPDAKLGMLYANIMVRPWEYARQLKIDYLHPGKANLGVPGFVEGSLAAGCGINVWTVNDVETMEVCFNCGAGIITNYPDVAVALKNK